MAKTTVVILNYNGDKWLDKLVSGLRKENCHIMIVDNASTDNSRNMADIKLNANWGYAQGNNIAGAMVKTENILFMNNDMLPKPGFLSLMEDSLSEEHPVVGPKLVFGETKHIDAADIHLDMFQGKTQTAGIGINSNLLPYEIGRGYERDFPEINKPKEVSGVTGACLLIKTSLFAKLRGFNTSFINGFEDVDLCWRAREMGHKSFCQPQAEVIHYCSSSVGRFDHEEQNRNLLISTWPKDRVQKIL